MTLGGGRRTLTRTFVTGQPAHRIRATLVDLLAPMWLTPKCVYTVAAPGPVDAVGSLRCCWVDRFLRGLRRTVVWELVRAEPLRVGYRDRSTPGWDLTVDLELTAEDAGTQVQLTMTWNRRWPSARLGRHAKLVEAGLREAIEGNVPPLIDPNILVWAPGAGASSQVNEIVIAAKPAVVWRFVDDPEGTQLPDPTVERRWTSTMGGVEWIYVIRHLPGDGLGCWLMKPTAQGRFRATTVDSLNTEVFRELLPHESGCLLRMTTRWNPPVRKNVMRAAARGWLARVKGAAEG